MCDVQPSKLLRVDQQGYHHNAGHDVIIFHKDVMRWLADTLQQIERVNRFTTKTAAGRYSHDA
jgi:hypothetical protein